MAAGGMLVAAPAQIESVRLGPAEPKMLRVGTAPKLPPSITTCSRKQLSLQHSKHCLLEAEETSPPLSTASKFTGCGELRVTENSLLFPSLAAFRGDASKAGDDELKLLAKNKLPDGRGVFISSPAALSFLLVEQHHAPYKKNGMPNCLC